MRMLVCSVERLPITLTTSSLMGRTILTTFVLSASTAIWLGRSSRL